MASLLSLVDADPLFCAGLPSRDETMLVIAGARVRFPRSLLSLFHVVPRTMTRYETELVGTEMLVGAIFSTAYNVRRNLGLGEEPVTMRDLERYFLDSENEVLTLVVNNTDFSNLSGVKKRGRRIPNPVIFRSGSIPILMVLESRKKVNIYRERTDEQANSSYKEVGSNLAIVTRYAGLQLVDVHTPSSMLTVSAVYGVTEDKALKKIGNDKELADYQSTPLSDPIRLSDFTKLFDGVKKSIQLTNVPVPAATETAS
ncbi:DNA-binding virion core protein VP8 [Bovine papular stomatitis virus]|uniref:Core protein VP8 n=1 Tax=Bovine papular stomatitis virus TaxID=129727 RepID=A0A0E3XAB6_9POXV|nr:DNA-binding virion core protein VP8 [Bovine papular stomatitis virus]AKC03348.1 DNA-binding virion core protein VP8 [Bovine papular stomatitis virus]AKC03476.1 DNA-binding virion core protein VP8 [Bovine papular stomatitis virus]